MGVEDFRIAPKPLVPLGMEGVTSWEAAPETGVVSGTWNNPDPATLTEMKPSGQGSYDLFDLAYWNLAVEIATIEAGKIAAKSLTDRELSHLVLDSLGYIRGGQTAYNTGTGFFLGYASTTYKLSIGDASANYLTWDGTTLSVGGTLTATAGAIGGFSIGSDYIRDAADSFGLASTVTGGDDVRFWAGDTFANRATADFRVTEAGAVTASNITATGGTIGGFTLSSTALYAGATVTRIQLDTTTGIHLGATAFADAPFRVSLAGALTATNATITGTVTASAGTIGGFTLGAATISATGIRFGASATQPYIEMPQGLSEFSGNGFLVFYTVATGATVMRAGTYSGGALVAGIHWDGANLQWIGTNTSLTTAGLFTATNAAITGAITASSGSVGSFTIGTYLYTGSKTAWNDANAGVHIGSDGIGIGNNVFTVNGSTGALVATSATITGAITASSGSITGPLTMSGASSSIAIGTTPPSSATVGTGLWLDRTGLYGLNANTQEFYLQASDGLLYAGGGNSGIDNEGFWMRPAASTNYLRIIAVGDTYPLARLFGVRNAVTPANDYVTLQVLNHSTAAEQGLISVGGSQLNLYTIPSTGATFGITASLGAQMSITCPAGQSIVLVPSGGAQMAQFNATGFYPGSQSTRYISDNGSNIVVDSVVVATHTHGGADQGGTVAVASVTGAAPLASPTFTGTVALPTATVATDIYTVDWTDYSGTSTIVGWSSFITKVLKYRKIGKLVFVYFSLYGTSDNAQVTFTLPYTNASDFPVWAASQSYDNGTAATTPGRISLPVSSATVEIFRDFASATWTASGSKSVTGEFFYTTA